jgi:putative membrane protein insertion efficiency factor
VLAGSRAVRRGLILLVRLYQVTLSWLLGGSCRFVPSCSDYALEALHGKPAWRAVGLIAWRVARCQPLCKGGFDDVPEDPQDAFYRLPEPLKKRRDRRFG